MDYTKLYILIATMILMSLSFMALIMFAIQEAKGEDTIQIVYESGIELEVVTNDTTHSYTISID